MLQQQSHTKPIPHAAAKRCAHCRRELPSGEGTDLPFVGVVGPECVRKYGRFLATLDAVNGLEAHEWDQGTVRLAHRVLWALRGIGVAVKVADVRAGVKALEIVGLSRTPKAVLKGWEQIRAEFEQRLRDAQAERDAQEAGLVA